MSWYRMFMALKRNGAKTENELKKKNLYAWRNITKTTPIDLREQSWIIAERKLRNE